MSMYACPRCQRPDLTEQDFYYSPSRGGYIPYCKRCWGMMQRERRKQQYQQLREAGIPARRSDQKAVLLTCQNPKCTKGPNGTRGVFYESYGNPNKYCSHSCSIVAHPPKQKTGITLYPIVCLYCHQVTHKRNKDARYCNQQCAGIHRGQLARGKPKPKRRLAVS